MRAHAIASATLASFAVSGAPAAALAQPAPAPESAFEIGGGGPPSAMWRLELGYRGAFVTAAGFNPFSTQDYFGQLSMSASRTVYHRGPLSFALGLDWDYGRSGAADRGDMASIEVHRLVAPLEGRVHFGPWGYAFLRAAPGVALESVELDDPSAPAPASSPSSPSPLTKSRWLFATDLSAGYAFPIVPRTARSPHAPRLWLQADGGYGWIAQQRLDLSAALPGGDPRPADGVDLGALALQGAFLRVEGAVSF